MRKIHSFYLNVSLKFGHSNKFGVILNIVNKEYFFYKMVVELIHS